MHVCQLLHEEWWHPGVPALSSAVGDERCSKIDHWLAALWQYYWYAGQSSLATFFWAHLVQASDDDVSVTAWSRPTILIRRPSSLGGYPVAATSAVGVFAAARRAAHTSSYRVLLVTEHSLLPVLRSGTVCNMTSLTVCHWHHSAGNWKLCCFLYHFHDYNFFFSGPWGFYLGHFKNFLCMYVCMYVCIYMRLILRSLGAGDENYYCEANN